VSETDLRIQLPWGGSVAAVAAEPEAEGETVFLYAPGAGSNLHDPFGRFICRDLAARGVRAIRFQFPYQEAVRRAPDRPAVLEDTWRAAIEQLRGARTFAGGRSMGGRIASQVVAQGVPVAGLVLFAYPLHPPGKPERRRDEHLAAITVPVLFCSGTNDAFASPEELAQAAALLRRSSVHFLAGADHGFNMPKASGRTREDVWGEAADAMWRWLEGL
jgi:predicted alpha/beta-hydrolase family hydrolase